MLRWTLWNRFRIVKMLIAEGHKIGLIVRRKSSLEGLESQIDIKRWIYFMLI